MRRALFAIQLLLALAVGTAGCKQGIGERCEQDSDCASGICSINMPGAGGFCRGPNDPGGGGGGGGSGDGGLGGVGGGAGSDASQDVGSVFEAGTETGAAPDADSSDAAEAGTAADDAAAADALVDAPIDT